MEENFRNLRLSDDNSNSTAKRSDKDDDLTETTGGQLLEMDNITPSSDGAISSEKINAVLGDSLAGMSEKEISQHLELCMKLSAEGKINMKNAFGLHLIAIMQQLVKGSTDLQFASLSLAASSKIYCGRVEALYKDTQKFHSHLQTIIAGGKTSLNVEDNEEDENDKVSSDKRKSSRKAQMKSFLTSESSINFLESEFEARSVSMQPHANFILTRSAFVSTRTAYKLLHCLKCESDSCEIQCGKAIKCFRMTEPRTETKFCLRKRQTGRMLKLKNKGHLEFDSMETSSSPPPVFSETDSLIIGDPVPPDETSYEVDEIIEKFSVLDITANVLIKEISQCVTTGDTIDRNLLPANSTLKKVLNPKKQKLPHHPTEKRKRKPQEPFFKSDLNIDKRLPVIMGKKTVFTDAALNAFSLCDTTVLTTGYNQFCTELAGTEIEKNYLSAEQELRRLELVCRTIEPPKVILDGYFIKKHQQVLNKYRGSSISFRMRPSSLGPLQAARVSRLNDEPEGLVHAFGQLSVEDSHNNSIFDEAVGGEPGADLSLELLQDIPTEPECKRVSLCSGILEDDINDILITPPELVKHLSVRYEMKPLAINTEKMKNLLSNIISEKLNKNDPESSTLLSIVYEALKEEFKNKKLEGLTLQYTFVMLLILANEKVLLIENIPASSDIVIKKDVSEIDSSEAF